jgi:hypothetical protein
VKAGAGSGEGRASMCGVFKAQRGGSVVVVTGQRAEGPSTQGHRGPDEHFGLHSLQD